MKQMFRWMLLGCVLSIGVFAAFGYALYFYPQRVQTSIHSRSVASPGIDLSDPRRLMGFSRFVFAAKVTKEISEKSNVIAPSLEFPHVQYEAEVLYDIKGNASGTVTVDVYKDAGTLTPGTTYLLATRPWKEPGWYYVNSQPESQAVISTDSTLSKDELIDLVKRNDRVYELLNAYPNEIIADADIRNNDILNAFKFLSDEDKQVIYAKFQELIPPRSAPDILPSPPPSPAPTPAAPAAPIAPPQSDSASTSPASSTSGQ